MLEFSVCFRASESLQSVLWHSRRTSFSFISVAQLTLYRFRCLCGSFQVVSLLKKISHKLNCTGLVPCLNFILYQTIMIDAGVSTQAPSDSMREVYKGNNPNLGNSPYVGSYIGALDCRVLFVSRVKAIKAQTRCFATIEPFLWNVLPSSLRITISQGFFLHPFLYLFISLYIFMKM